MSDKISPIKVIKEAVRLYRDHLKASIVYGLLPLVGLLLLMALIMPLAGNQGTPAEAKVGVFLFGFLLLLLGMIAYSVSIMNYGVTALRGAPRILPDRPVRRMLVFLWRGVLIYLLLLLVSMVASLPVQLILSPASGVAPASSLRILFLIGFQLILTFVLVIGMYRLYFQFPAAALGEDTSFKTAWRISRGHAWRMFWSHFLLQLPLLGIELLFFLPLYLLQGRSGVASATLEGVFLLVILGYVVFITPVFYHSVSIWYEALRRRDLALQDAPPDPGAFAS